MNPIETTPGPLVPFAGASRRGCHRLGTFNDCPQSFGYCHELGLKPVKEPEGRAHGALLHIGLMWHYLARAGRSDADPIEKMRQAPARIAWTFEKARERLQAYRAFWGQVGDDLEVLDVEREFEVTAGGFLHTQRMDLTVKRHGKAWVLDHKTTSGWVNTHAKEWAESLQFLSASLIGRAVFPDVYGLEFGGVLINVIGTGRDLGFARHELVIPAEALQKTVRSIVWPNKLIAELESSGLDPWDWPRTWKCQGRYGPCDYRALCQRGKSALGEYVTARDEASEVEA